MYGPLLGRLYLLSERDSSNRSIQRLLGLKRYRYCASLTDPAIRIVHDRSSAGRLPLLTPPIRLCVAYRLFQHLRSIIPFQLMVRLLCLVAKRRQVIKEATAADIGRLVHSIERKIGFGDCYPRTLLTAYLCVRNRLSCELTVGSLVPTRKMHAWCSTDGLLPYEDLPQHYMYQPLVIVKISA